MHACYAMYAYKKALAFTVGFILVWAVMRVAMMLEIILELFFRLDWNMRTAGSNLLGTLLKILVKLSYMEFRGSKRSLEAPEQVDTPINYMHNYDHYYSYYIEDYTSSYCYH